MLFNSFHFLLFFPLVTTLYFTLPHRWRWFMLLMASCYFYMVFRPVYILILAFTILIDYYAGIWIGDAEGKRRKLYLLISIAANVGVLAFFKYYNFLNDTLTGLFGAAGTVNPIPALDILLPIGLSFHTFQSLSYTIEVYRRKQEPERHFGLFALYVMFYPQLVAGPIERPQNLLHQFREYHRFDYERLYAGLRLMCWGLFKKVVVADRLAPFVNVVYQDPTQFPGVSLLIATFFFAFQIYCDFSGYSDIAIGAAQVMGFDLMKNFRQPYFSASVGEFWRRWHISLSTWFKDYLYIPLGGSRVALPRQYLNLLITFLVSGLWHGANWTYVIWGGLNGIYLVAEQIVEQRSGLLDRIPAWFRSPYRLVRTGVTFALICVSWIFFRATHVDQAFYILRHLGDGLGDLPANLRNLSFVRNYVLMGLDKNEFLIGIAAIAFLLGVEYAQKNGHVGETIVRQPAVVRWAVYYAAVAAVVFLGAFNSAQEFIYFQF